MNKCDDTKLLIKEYFSGEITLTEFRALHQHIKSCEYCRVLMELNFEATSDDQSIPMPTAIQLEEMRSSVLGRIAKETRKSVEIRKQSNKTKILQFPEFKKQWARGFGIAAMLVIAIGFGRWSNNFDSGLEPTRITTSNSFDSQDLVSEQSLIEQLTQQAAYQKPQQDLRKDYWDSPVFYSNVSFGKNIDQSLKLGFDICRRIDINTTTDSALTKEVMLHAILNPTTPGGQFKAMQMAATTQDDRLIEAMILTMQNDQELAVRLEAFSILSKMPQTATIESAFLSTLRNDSSVKMRLVVLKQLSENYNLSNEVLANNIEKGSKDNAAALYYAIRPNTKSVKKM